MNLTATFDSNPQSFLISQNRGVRFGRPRKLNAEQEQLARRLISEGKAVREIAKIFKVHVATIYRLSDVSA